MVNFMLPPLSFTVGMVFSVMSSVGDFAKRNSLCHSYNMQF